MIFYNDRQELNQVIVFKKMSFKTTKESKRIGFEYSFQWKQSQ